jgi:hypothetical protein
MIMLPVYQKQEIPSLHPITEDTSIWDVIMLFYKDAGWSGSTHLDVRRIVVNPANWMEMSAHFADEARRTGNGEFFFMNYGPSANADVPFGEVWLLEGCFKKEVNVSNLLERSGKQ